MHEEQAHHTSSLTDVLASGHSHGHSQQHSHQHPHEYVHDHPHEHTHEHLHEPDEAKHDHGHVLSAHTHDHESQDLDGSHAFALLSYLVEHNVQHTNELFDLAHSAENAGMPEVARLIREGAEHCRNGNNLLARAQHLAQKERR